MQEVRTKIAGLLKSNSPVQNAFISCFFSCLLWIYNHANIHFIHFISTSWDSMGMFLKGHGVINQILDITLKREAIQFGPSVTWDYWNPFKKIADQNCCLDEKNSLGIFSKIVSSQLMKLSVRYAVSKSITIFQAAINMHIYSSGHNDMVISLVGV